jgi:hypothetical protein
MSENLTLYGAVYADMYAALADLENFENLSKRELVGAYDAAVIDVPGDGPHIVRRMRRPTLELIPELVGRGRPPIGVLPEPLAAGESALAVIGSAELKKGFKRAAGRAAFTSERPLASEELGAITVTRSL